MVTIQKKVLIIDDEKVFRDAMVDALTPCGYRCTAEDNPADGIKRMKIDRYDLLLLDIMMDPLDGWDTLEHIRTLPQDWETPVILASAKALQADEIIRYGECVAGFLRKPFESSEFCEDVNRFFSWYDALKSDGEAAESKGVPRQACNDWIRLSRQIQAIRRLKEVVSPRCIPDGFLTEAECLAHKMGEIERIISEKTLERDNLQIQYPALALQ